MSENNTDRELIFTYLEDNYYVNGEKNLSIIDKVNGRGFTVDQMIDMCDKMFSINTEWFVNEWYTNKVDEVKSIIYNELDKFEVVMGNTKWDLINKETGDQFDADEIISRIDDDLDRDYILMIIRAWKGRHILKVVDEKMKLGEIDVEGWKNFD